MCKISLFFFSEMHRALSAWPKYTLNPSFWSDMSKHCGVFLSGPHKGILYYFCLSGPRRRVLYYFLLVRSTPRDSLLFSFTQVHTKWFFTQQHRIFTYQAQNTQQSIPKQRNRKGHQTFFVLRGLFSASTNVFIVINSSSVLLIIRGW